MRFLPLFLAVLFVAGASAQSTDQNIKKSADGNWWTLQQPISESAFIEAYFPGERLRLIESKTDDIGMKHSRYAQVHHHIKVEGAQFILHSDRSGIRNANGRLVSEISASAQPVIPFEKALELAKKATGAEKFYWEIPHKEQELKSIKNDPTATYAPSEELVFMDPAFSQDGSKYRLAYKFDLYFAAVHDHKTLFIDAQNGSVLFEEEGCHTGSVQGVAHTKYSGTRTIITDSISPNLYVLRDQTRGGGIETYNMFADTSHANAQLFEDTDNIWNNFNAQFNEVGTDVHWGTEVTFDYFLNEHSRNSFDDQGSKLVSYVHFDSAYFNAFWNGVNMHYGDGNGNPLTSIDVVGHEITHGVTNFTSDLVYAWEPGALNESFSDIFGTAIEFYGKPDSADWEMGMLDFLLRDMSNPNVHNQPDTYLGNLWWTSPFDNGGVHFNSGVQNYWWYSLCAGNSGTNDLGHVFNVDSIGMEKSSKIAYRNLVYYLTPTSQFYDARQGSILAAEDLYGSCSNEVIQVAKAWYAVGVGPDTLVNDLEMVAVSSPISNCSLSNQENLTISFTLHRSGCDSIIPAGDTLHISYRANAGAPVTEDYVLPGPLNSEDTLVYTFSNTADLSQPGSYLFDFWVKYKDDQLAHNDSAVSYQVYSTGTINAEDSVTFEVARQTYESTISTIQERAHSLAVIEPQARSKGFRGLRMTGYDFFGSTFEIPSMEPKNFEINPDFQSDVCMCVDASTWNHVTLSFDLKQTFSGIYKQQIGFDIPELVSSLRVTVDGMQQGAQYHPSTYYSDSWQRHYMNLDQYAGQTFRLCFEGKHYFNRQEDPAGTFGDNSYLDHIKLEDYQYISIDELALSSLELFPNPGSGVFRVTFESPVQGDLLMTVIDPLGRTIYSGNEEVVKGSNSISMDLQSHPSGLYVLQLELEGKQFVKTLIIE